MTQFDMTGYLSIFLEEVDEQLTILDAEVLKLEREPYNETTIQHIFRAAHTLKGSSAAMGFEQMKELTHHLENVFDNIRQQNIAVTKPLIEIIFESIDSIRLLKEEILNETVGTFDIAPLIERLAVDTESSESAMRQPMTTHQFTLLDEYQQMAIEHTQTEGYIAYDILVCLEESCTMKNVRALVIHNSLQRVGEIISITPDAQAIENDFDFNGMMQLVLLTNAEQQTVEIVLEQSSEVEMYSVKVWEQHVQQEEKPIIPVVEDVPPKTTEAVVPTKAKTASTVRVDVEKLEYLMNLVGELVIDQTRLVDVRGRFAEKNIKNDVEFEILDEVTNHLNRVVSELQEGMMKTRMMPIEQLFNRFPRMVRDTALKANKEINFVVEGKETDLDRTLIEEISDPIIHLLRNSIDHGIESVDERIRAHKPTVGTVTLRAAHEDNHVVISIQDDGKGIDIERVKAKAVEKGFISAEESAKMTDKDAMFLIFHSGMSTAEQITDISGRGVGMDIVRSHIEKLNGVIEIESMRGVGTTFSIKLPLTLAIIRSLLVKFSNRTFAIPLTNVIEIARLNEEDIQVIQNKEVGMIRGRILPLVRMNKLMNLGDNMTTDRRKREFVVVVGIADKRIGLIADRTLGNQEIVIKSLGSYIGSPAYISGATIMGDGSVALILDVNEVVKERGSQLQNDEQQLEQNTVSEQQLVTFKVGGEEYGIEIQQAKDIIALSHITEVANAPEDVLGLINLRGKMLPVYDLRKRLGLPKANYTKKTRIIVMEYEGNDIGFLVDEVTQVMKVTNLEIEAINVYKERAHTELIQGVTKLENRVVFILALEQLLQQVHIIEQ